MARTLILAGTVALAALLAYLTVAVAIDDGVTIIVVFALVMFGLIAFGAIGALTSRDDED